MKKIMFLLLSACWLTSGMAFNQAQQLFLLCVRNAPPTPPLPYDAEVEYLESTGTQWIDTLYYPNASNFGYRAEITYYNDLPATRTIMGTWGPGSWVDGSPCISMGGNYRGSYGGSNKNWRCGDGNTYLNVPRIRLGEKAVVKVINNNDETDGKFHVTISSPLVNDTVLYDRPYVGTSTQTFVISGIRNGNGAVTEIPHCRFYHVQLLEFSTVVRDFISVRFTNDQNQNEGAMYDRVSGQLFRNAGTGAFVIGPDK